MSEQITSGGCSLSSDMYAAGKHLINMYLFAYECLFCSLPDSACLSLFLSLHRKRFLFRPFVFAPFVASSLPPSRQRFQGSLQSSCGMAKVRQLELCLAHRVLAALQTHALHMHLSLCAFASTRYSNSHIHDICIYICSYLHNMCVNIHMYMHILHTCHRTCVWVCVCASLQQKLLCMFGSKYIQ